MNDVENLFKTAFTMLKMEIDILRLTAKEREELLTIFIESKNKVEVLTNKTKSYEVTPQNIP